jgi:hypothetical protein
MPKKKDKKAKVVNILPDGPTADRFPNARVLTPEDGQAVNHEECTFADIIGLAVRYWIILPTDKTTYSIWARPDGPSSISTMVLAEDLSWLDAMRLIAEDIDEDLVANSG